MIFDRFSLKEKINTLFKRDKGAIAIITGLGILVFIGFAALAIDVGTWYSQKRQLQIAADAGAIGGAIALSKTGKSTLNTYVNHDLALNGCTAANNCTIVAINNPPASPDPLASNTFAVEVVLSKPAPLFLSRLFLASPPNLHARAVAGKNQISQCAVILSNSGIGLNAKGGSTLNSPNCGVYVDSNASNAVNTTGNALINAKSVSVVGGVNTSGGGTITGPISSGAATLNDPFSGLQIPPFSGCNQTNFSTHGTVTINPGVYCGGINLGSHSVVTMSPGTYFLDQGSLTVGAQTTLTGTGVTIILTSSTGSNYGTVSIVGGTSVNLSPSTTGPLAGVLMFEDRNSSGVSVNLDGGSTQVLSGLLYFPTANVDYNGQATTGASTCLQIVANTLTLTGASSFGNNCPTNLGNIQLFE